MLNDFLLEIGCEELPFAAVSNLAEALVANMTIALEKAQLGYQSIKSFATPRRLALLVTQLQDEQPSQNLVRRGPALAAAYDEKGEPSKALLGFAKSCNVNLQDMTVTKTDKGEWLVYESVQTGSKTCDLLPGLIRQVIADLPIAKPMRWGNGDTEFARPVHWLVMVYGEAILPCEILGLQADRITYGHRFHAPQAIAIPKPEDYEALLAKAYVIADYDRRRAMIIEQVQACAKTKNAQAIMPEDLLKEVTAIVEWPQALVANFAPEFLEVPSEALVASMQSHQKCFSLQDEAGTLLPSFVTVTNINSRNAQQVIAGNEKVMRARLSDAAFFFQQDKKQPLSYWISATENVVFQAKLGSLQDKAIRIKRLMAYLRPFLQLDAEQAGRAAELSKCDLMTGMVGEFPELQGLMGYYYAQHDGEEEAVALALNEQYLPRFAGDALPTTSLGLALSLADRLDTLVGIFAIGQKPSGVKDPFKLRRHALAVVRLLLSTPAKLGLADLIQETLAIYGQPIAQNKAAVDELPVFILERLQSFYQSKGHNSDLVHAVRARQDNWLFDFDKRASALADFITRPEAASLSAACKRVNNLLNQAQLQPQSITSIREELLEAGAEQALFSHLQAMEAQIKPYYEQGDYGRILNLLAGLKEPVDAFFETVMVMADNLEVRQNRLMLLMRLQTLLQGVADISLLQLQNL